MPDSFVHLHQHTEFSMLDGASRVKPVVAKAAADGNPAMGITDHGVLYGIPSFGRACEAAGIKPIFGTELNAVDDRFAHPSRRGRKDDDGGGEVAGGGKLYYHLTSLAETTAGYRNLIKLSTRAYLEGFFYKARVDWDLLEQYHDGLIVTSGCLGGMILQALVPSGIMNPDKEVQDPFSEQDRFAKAMEIAGRLQDIFGRENFFIEVQDHGIPSQTWSNPRLIQMAKKLRAPLLATNDSHYVDQHDHVAHDALLCVQTGSKISDVDRMRFHGDQHYLKSALEMRFLFRDIPQACDNTLWVAERCDVDLGDPKPKLPKFPLPEGFHDAKEYLAKLTWDGATLRWGETLPKEHVDRLTFELDVIDSMGFNDYFLIVWDLIRFAKEQGARVGPGRGSAAGCAVAYSLGITQLDPVKYDLLFERFLNPERISMPDIDLDIDTRFRETWLDYTRRLYGDDRVCQIITFSEIKARAAVRDAARVLDYPFAVGDKIAKAVPGPIMGRSTPIEACLTKTAGYERGFDEAAALREMYASDAEVTDVIDVAKGLEGLRRGTGIHAAAVVIADRPLLDIVPLQRTPQEGGAVEDAPIVSQYEMAEVEALGLLKMDYLGLRNLDVITDTVKLVEQVHGVVVDIDGLDLDNPDPKTMAMLQRAETLGVFQLESTGMQDLIRRLRPTTFDDIGALVSLYRPGPMASNMHLDYADRKNGRKGVEYMHPDADLVLGSTYGLMIYQEEMMRIAQRFAGYTLAQSDSLRKACGKKNRELMAKERSKFVAGCIATGYTEQIGEAWFDVIEPFADYSFNKSHAYGYGLISYQTAYLKANHPHEYMAALLTSVMSKQETAAPLLLEAKRMGVPVLPPDVNRSDSGFTVARDDDGNLVVPYGLAGVRDVGEGVVAHLVAARAEGPFVDIYDFCDRVNESALNKKTTDALIKGGAFDSLGYSRKGLLMVSETIVDQTKTRRRNEAGGQFDLFSAMTPESADVPSETRPVVPDDEWDRKVKLAFEKEMLGLYVSDHPLAGMERRLGRYSTASVSDLADKPVNAKVKVAGIVGALAMKYNKTGNKYATFMIEDLTGSAEVIAFSRTVEECGELLAADRIVVVGCRIDERGEKRQLVATDISALPGDEDSKDVVVAIETTTDAFTSVLVVLRDCIDAYPGDSPVHVLTTDKGQRWKLGPTAMVDPRSGFVAELKEMFGDNAVSVV